MHTECNPNSPVKSSLYTQLSWSLEKLIDQVPARMDNHDLTKRKKKHLVIFSQNLLKTTTS